MKLFPALFATNNNIHIHPLVYVLDPLSQNVQPLFATNSLTRTNESSLLTATTEATSRPLSNTGLVCTYIIFELALRTISFVYLVISAKNIYHILLKFGMSHGKESFLINQEA
ncbi:unnamed protein product [Lupinus luteus]|uniref:Uncharacterized protein n=1 Tax=Lupinus luteus TaxID=3873 RepID=A0AAV1WP91_LUPLU